MNEQSKRRELTVPGPMIPPVPAILTTVKGEAGVQDEISVLWTFITNGKPAQIGVTADKSEHFAEKLIKRHGEFVLNVMTIEYTLPFDKVDMNSSAPGDKFAISGLTRGTASKIDSPTIEEAVIQLECKVTQSVDLPPNRTLFLADVIVTSVLEGVCDENERLIVESTPFFGMTAGSGEFYTMGKMVGHIGETVGRDDIKY